MFGISSAEILFIAVVALVLFGPDKIPDVARWLGRAYREVSRFTQDFRGAITDAVSDPAEDAQPKSDSGTGDGGGSRASGIGTAGDEESFYAKKRLILPDSDDYLGASKSDCDSRTRLTAGAGDDYIGSAATRQGEGG